VSRKTLLLFMVIAVLNVPATVAQTKEKLSLLIQHIYGPNGLHVDSQAVNLDGTTHIAHFNDDFQQQFRGFNTALASQLTSLPLPSPAAGFTYTLDLSTGLQQRSTQSFGPLLTDRAETIGKNNLSFGFNYQQFRFDKIEGVNLSSFQTTYQHEDPQLGGGRTDLITGDNSLDASIGELISFLTYGFTDHLDVSVAVPVVQTRLSMVSDATIIRIGTIKDPTIHYYYDSSVPGGYGVHRQFSNSGTARGLGDIILRVKDHVLRRERMGVAFALDVRFPTGDELNLLGSGAYGVKPSVAASFLFKRLSPHLNFGYQWNGQSLLAGDLKSVKAALPAQLLYSAGFDYGVSNKLTLAFDFLGQRVINSPRLGQSTFVGADGITYPEFRSRYGSFDLNSGSVGFKTNLVKRLLVNFNVRFRLNHAGLHEKPSPMVGIEYTF
jgi:hypothetical protein